jgi:hypothetical protein
MKYQNKVFKLLQPGKSEEDQIMKELLKSGEFLQEIKPALTKGSKTKIIKIRQEIDREARENNDAKEPGTLAQRHKG